MLRGTRISIDKTLNKICLHTSITISNNSSQKLKRNIHYLLNNGLIIKEPIQYHNKITYTASTSGILKNSNQQAQLNDSAYHSVRRLTCDLFIDLVSLIIYGTACGLIRNPNNIIISFILLILCICCVFNIIGKNISYLYRNKQHDPKLHKLYSLIILLIGLLILVFAVLILVIKIILPII